MTDDKSLIKTIVIGLNVLFASLYQINEMAQKIIARTKELYVLSLLFNLIPCGEFTALSGANLYLKSLSNIIKMIFFIIIT
jgi:hypothetical protein